VEKAPDAFRTISEVAQELDVPQHVLRFWESRFREIRPMKRGGGRRYYRPDDVDLLRGIRHLLYGEGYTIRGVQRLLREQGVRFVQGIWRPGAQQPGHPPPEDATDDEVIIVFASGDTYRLPGFGSCQEIDGRTRWSVSLPQDERDWSPHLAAGNMYLADMRSPLLVRKDGSQTVLLTSPSVGVEFLTRTTMAGEWVLFLQAENCDGAAPELAISIRLRCT